MLDPSVPARASVRAEPESSDAVYTGSHNSSDVIGRWLKLKEIARTEPSLPVWRPRSKRAKARWARVDAKWRALLAEARAKGRADAASQPPTRPLTQPSSGGFFHAPMRGRE